MEPINEKKLVSTYNQAFAQLGRLDRAWSACNLLSSNGELIRWKWQLDIIWRELIADANILDDSTNKEEEKYKNKIKKINSKIAIAKTKIELYNVLCAKEELLRILEDDSGKGSKRSAEDEDDFEE